MKFDILNKSCFMQGQHRFVTDKHADKQAGRQRDFAAQPHRRSNPLNILKTLKVCCIKFGIVTRAFLGNTENNIFSCLHISLNARKPVFGQVIP